MWRLSDAELINLKCQKLFVPLIYAELIAKIIDKWGDKAEERLREFGRNIGEGILKVWQPENTKSIKKIMQETYKFLLKQKPPIEMEKDGRTLIIKDEDCVLCWNVQAGDIHYCTPYGSLLETVVNFCREKKNPDLPKIWVETTKSKAMGSDYCEHVIHFI